MRVLLIGGTGLLSSAIAQRSLQLGHTVYVLNRGYRKAFLPIGAILLQADIHNQEEVRACIEDKKFDVIVDFLSYREKELFNTLQLLSQHCLQFIFISSCAVYKKPDIDGFFRETSELGNAEWSYGREKLKCEILLKKYMDRSGQYYTIVRPSITYGDTRLPYHIMPAYGWHWSLVERIRHGKALPCWNHGEGKTTVTHVLDFAKGVVGLFMNERAFNNVFHITTDQICSWREIAEVIGNNVGERVKFVDIPAKYFSYILPMYRGIIRGSRGRDALYNNDKIKSVVPEFNCEIDLNTGVAMTLEYYKKHDFIKGIDYIWDADMDYLINHYNNAIGSPVRYAYIEYLKGDSMRGAMEIYKKRQTVISRFQIFVKSIVKRVLGRE